MLKQRKGKIKKKRLIEIGCSLRYFEIYYFLAIKIFRYRIKMKEKYNLFYEFSKFTLRKCITFLELILTSLFTIFWLSHYSVLTNTCLKQIPPNSKGNMLVLNYLNQKKKRVVAKIKPLMMDAKNINLLNRFKKGNVDKLVHT